MSRCDAPRQHGPLQVNTACASGRGNLLEEGVRYAKEGPSNGGKRNNFGLCEKTKFKKGQHSSWNSNFQRSTSPRGGKPDPMKVHGGDMHHHSKNCVMCGRPQSGEC